jgi:hypothetical protein
MVLFTNEDIDDLEKEEIIDQLEIKNAESIETFFKEINTGFGGYNAKYIDVLYFVDPPTYRRIARNFNGDYNMTEESSPMTVEDYSKASHIPDNLIFDNTFRVINGHIKQEDVPLFIPRIYCVPYDKDYFSKEDPIGILYEPTRFTEVIRIDPLSNHDVDNVYKIETKKVRNSEYIDYIKYIRDSVADTDLAGFDSVEINNNKKLVDSYDNDNFAIIADTCKTSLVSRNTKDTIYSIMDKIRNSTSNNILAYELLARVFLKNTYILSRSELYSPPECYPKEEVSIYDIQYNIGLDHDERTLYLIEVGSKIKEYNSNSYIDESNNNPYNIRCVDKINSIKETLIIAILAITTIAILIYSFLTK